jgi:YidC/Oxa1 family membrane protein insertase
LSGIINSIAAVMKYALDLIYDLTNNYGLSIILLTFLIRLVMHPLVVTQTKNTEAMKELNPKLKELQAKYKNKPEVYQERMMQLYKENKVNPLGGCLPVLLQWPLLFAFFAMLRQYDFGGSGFFWIEDLTQPDSSLVLPILSGLTTYIQTAMTATDPSQKMMTFFMPVFITAITLRFQSGLALYWVASNTFSIFQQWWIVKQMGNEKGEGKKNEIHRKYREDD